MLEVSADMEPLSEVAAKRADELAKALSEVKKDAPWTPSGADDFAFEIISVMMEFPEERKQFALRVVTPALKSEDFNIGFLNEVITRISAYFETILDVDSASGFSHSISEMIEKIPNSPVRLRTLAVGETPLLRDETKSLLNEEVLAHSKMMARYITEICTLGRLNQNELTGKLFTAIYNKAFEKLKSEISPIMRLYTHAAGNEEDLRKDPAYMEVLKTLDEDGKRLNRLPAIRHEAIEKTLGLVKRLRTALNAEAQFTALDAKTRRALLEVLRSFVLYLKKYDGKTAFAATFSDVVVCAALDLDMAREDESHLATDIRIAFYENDIFEVNALIKSMLGVEPNGI